ncbi:Transcription factor spt8 [Haplosporangium sp. Z 767]|nr:Transcription factor spt8 [Haplosporangium sp. Z 767]
MDSEHESEDDFNNNDDNRTEDGSDRGDAEEASEPPTVTALPTRQPDETATSNRTHRPLVLQPNVLDCKSFDIMPCVLAVHPCNIYCMAATQCMRWVFTGSEDGYIRKYDFFASMNGKTMLTQGQRHGQVESVTKAGILTSYWENEEQPNKAQPLLNEDGLVGESSNQVDMDVDANIVKREGSVDRGMNQSVARAMSPMEESKMSAVYSLDCHSEAIFAISGLESGSINLWTPRHEEGTCHHVFRQHTGPVSALKLTPDQQGFISGSWDHNVLQWDLNHGAIVRTYTGHGSQISSLSFQPADMPAVHMDFSDPATNYPDNSILMSTSVDGTLCLWDRRDPTQLPRKLQPPEKVPPWCLSACWSADGKRIYCGRRNGTGNYLSGASALALFLQIISYQTYIIHTPLPVDEWDFAEGRFIQSIKMPANSGPVSFVKSLPNNKHLVCASQDNIRLWNITELDSKSSLRPFQIIAGHHGGLISNVRK